MIVYLIAFILSTGFAALGSRRTTAGGRPGPLELASLCCAALVPAAVSGLRQLSVGTDTSGYVRELFLSAAQPGTSLGSFLLEYGDRFEPGYLMLCYVVGLTGSFHFFLFVMELLTVGSVLVALAIHFRGVGLAAAYLAYLLMHYNESLNMMRQSLAMSVVLLAVVALLHGRRLWFLIGVGTAALFHTSGLIALAYPLLLWVSHRESFVTRKRLEQTRVVDVLALASLVLVPVLIVVHFKDLAAAILSDGGMDNRYSIYLTDSTNGVALPLAVGFAALVLIALPYSRRVREGLFLVMSMAIGAVLYWLTGVSQHLWRVSVYFTLVSCLMVGELISSRQSIAVESWSREFRMARSGTDRAHGGARWAGGGALVVMAVMWYIEIVRWRNHGTVPYLSVVGWL